MLQIQFMQQQYQSQQVPQFKKLLAEKNKRLEQVPAALQDIVKSQQKKILAGIISQLAFDMDAGRILPTTKNLNLIDNISDKIKSVIFNKEYLAGIKEFAGQFDEQASLNEKVIEKAYGN